MYELLMNIVSIVESIIVSIIVSISMSIILIMIMIVIIILNIMVVIIMFNSMVNHGQSQLFIVISFERTSPSTSTSYRKKISNHCHIFPCTLCPNKVNMNIPSNLPFINHQFACESDIYCCSYLS